MRWISFAPPKNVSAKKFLSIGKLLNEQCIYIKLILNHAGFIHEIGCLLGNLLCL